VTREELATILEQHAKWLRDGSGEHANLRRADLRRANLGDADLKGADLRGADLRDADLRDADLGNANLGDADLRGADLGGANLRGADLGGADLRGADLGGSCLAPFQTPFDWAVANACEMRCIGARTLVLGVRTRNQPHMGGPSYELSKLYRAPYFSRDPNTTCHPGLYVETGPEKWVEANDRKMFVAFWLDEMHIVGKCRVPRFRTLATRDEFDRLTTDDMERDTEAIPMSIYG
jgi:hypothetical protein